MIDFEELQLTDKQKVKSGTIHRLKELDFTAKTHPIKIHQCVCDREHLLRQECVQSKRVYSTVE